MSENGVSRRQVLGIGAGLTLAPSLVLAKSAKPMRVLRVAHLTDIHVQPERAGGKGMEMAIEHALTQKPDLIMNGGDCVMDVFANDEARAKTLWGLFNDVRKGLKTPIIHCIGNHDIWGWNKSASKTTGNEAKWGKRWAMDEFERDMPYMSFDRAGWHFVVLDSTFPDGNGYTAKLDDPQFEWLADDLAKTKLPTLVLSHQPLFGACPFLDGDLVRGGNWVVPGAWMHTDFRRIKDLFRKHAHVKVCISGHIHLADRVEYLGVTYLCNGAVSGGWWGGNYQEFPPMYALVDLFEDGTFESKMVEYGWKTQP